MDNNILKIAYTLFLGAIIAIFIGLGTATFYPAPKWPQNYPTSSFTGKEPTEAEIQKMNAEQERFNAEMKQHEKDSKVYSRNIVIIMTTASILLLVASLALERFSPVLANGVLLGGLFTLLYGIANGFLADDNRYPFAAVTVGLLVALFIGFRRFAAVGTGPKKPAKKKRH